MGQRVTKNFERRFADKISVYFPEKVPEPVEQEIRNTKLVKAFTDVLSGILKREPTQEELLGIIEVKVPRKFSKI